MTDTNPVTAAELDELHYWKREAEEFRDDHMRLSREIASFRQQLAEAQEREAQMAAALREIKRIVYLPDPASTRTFAIKAVVDAAIAQEPPASPSPVLRDAVIEDDATAAGRMKCTSCSGTGVAPGSILKWAKNCHSCGGIGFTAPAGSECQRVRRRDKCEGWDDPEERCPRTSPYARCECWCSPEEPCPSCASPSRPVSKREGSADTAPAPSLEESHAWQHRHEIAETVKAIAADTAPAPATETCTHPWAHHSDNGLPVCAGCGEDWTNVMHPEPASSVNTEDTDTATAPAIRTALVRRGTRPPITIEDDAPAPAISGGEMVSVPRIPTVEMVEAGGRQQAGPRGGPDSIYRAMIDAALAAVDRSKA